MEDKKWLSFEKSGRVSDYLTYCRSSIGKYADYETDSQGRSGMIYGALLPIFFSIAPPFPMMIPL